MKIKRLIPNLYFYLKCGIKGKLNHPKEYRNLGIGWFNVLSHCISTAFIKTFTNGGCNL